MSERYGVTTLEELATPPIPGQARWHTIRRTLGVSSFGVNAWTATEDGGQIIGEHEEASGQAHEELYIVLTGRATFTVDGDEVDGPAGTLVHVADPAVICVRDATQLITTGQLITVDGASGTVVLADTPSRPEVA